MSYQNKINYSTIPNQWFFLNPFKTLNENAFHRIKKNVGVIFFCNDFEKKNFFKRIEPYVNLCKKKNIKFIVPNSIYWVNKYKANGVMINQDEMKRKKFHILKYNRKILISSKVHNFKEAIIAKNFSDLIFLSPVFKSNSYPQKKKLSNHIFISLCFFLKEKVIFALGGVNFKNFPSLRCKHLYGFGAISFFSKKND